MQTWHCIVIIAFSLGAFLYVTFLDNIDNEVAITLEQLNEVASGTSSNDSLSQDKTMDSNESSQSNLSEKILLINSDDSNQNILGLHRSVLEGGPFMSILLSEINKIENIKDEILNPFISDLHSIDEKTILSSLFSCIPNSGSLEIICRGHSQRTANLLAELILRTYKSALAFEKNSAPLLPELVLLVDEISDLQAEANVLKITVHDKLADDPRDSIFVMATNSEILQIDQEISSLRNHLTEIDSIYRNNLHPLKLVEVKPVAEFGQIRELSDVLAQLKSLQKDADLNAFTQEEVKKKIHETSQNLEKEVINAIDQLKTKRKSDLA